MSSPFVTLSFDKWIKERWLYIESVHWGKLNKSEAPRESPHEVPVERDRKQNILLRIPLREISVFNHKQTSTERGNWIAANKIKRFTT